jgi:hypothetical protein
LGSVPCDHPVHLGLVQTFARRFRIQQVREEVISGDSVASSGTFTSSNLSILHSR